MMPVVDRNTPQLNAEIRRRLDARGFVIAASPWAVHPADAGGAQPKHRLPAAFWREAQPLRRELVHEIAVERALAAGRQPPSLRRRK